MPLLDTPLAWLRQWSQPSLSGRVVKAVLLAFLLVVAVLVAVDFVAYRRGFEAMQPLQDAVEALALALPADEARAVDIVKASERQYNFLRARTLPPHPAEVNDLLFELSVPGENRIAYASAGLKGQALPPQSGPVLMVDLAGQRYSGVQTHAFHWRVRLLQAVLNDTTALQWLVQSLTGSVLIAFPLVLLPVWWAVRRGLAPLQTLVDKVTGRAPGDFTPLRLNLRLRELQPLVDTFNQLFARSQSAVERERSLVQDAAHELRTPLAVITTQAHTLAAAGSGPAKRQALLRLESAIARASHQVHQVLTLARIEGQGQRLAQPVECVEAVRQALIEAEPRARAGGIELSLDAPEQLRAELDWVAFHSVLDNLLTNALNHAHGATRIHIDLSVADGFIELRVADDGIGVHEDDRPRLFERFHRGRDATAPGSGLGLSIVLQAATLMGGDVQLASGLGGRGVSFGVRVPLRAGTGAVPDAPAAAAAAST